jgi:MSHA biogenesis protein MshI
VLFTSRSSHQPGWVACVPQGEQAVWACVEPVAGARPAVRWLATEDWHDATATLKRLRRTRSLHRRRTVALLPRGQYQLRQLDAPELPRGEWAQAVRWQLQDQVDFAVDNAAIDVLEIPRETSRRAPQLLAVAAAHEPLRPLVQAAHDARTPWQALDIAETALRNLSALVEPAGRAQALLHFQRSHGTLVISAGGELLAARDLDIGLDALLDADDTARQAATDRVMLELQRTLDGFERQFTQVSLARLLVAPGAPLAAFCEQARDAIFVPVATFDAAEALDLSALGSVDEPMLAQALTAIGAALRGDG